MTDRGRRLRAAWSCCALAASLFFAGEAAAGNFCAVVPNNSGIEYFSVEMIPGQTLQGVGSCRQILIDDITYAPWPAVTYSYVPFFAPTWGSPPFTATYEAGSPFGWIWPLDPWLQYWTYGGGGFPGGTLPSGRTITFDVEFWGNSHQLPVYEQVQELDYLGSYLRGIDEADQIVVGELQGRGEHLPGGGGRGDVGGVGVAESVLTLSRSRRFKTPHIVLPPDQVGLTMTGGVMFAYVKGRVVVDGSGADDLNLVLPGAYGSGSNLWQY